LDNGLRGYRDAALALLERLILRGRQISDRLRTTPDTAVDIRSWQQDCAVVVNELSGGSKAHWLSRAFSAAFLVQPPAGGPGGVVVEASAVEIVDRLLDVLAQARASLSGMDETASASPLSAAPAPRRFDFVHNAELRPVLEQAYVDSGRALEAGDLHLAFITASSMLEAIITDALEHAGGNVAAWSFDERIAAAERGGLIRGGCARLPAAARTYRSLAPDATISAREAKLVRQVLHVVMRDLDPGR
jgi:hypothetical protein